MSENTEKKEIVRAKKFINEFKAMISRGNVVDMAFGVIIGGAFGKIVTSLVNDIIMPLISILTGGMAIEDWKLVIKEAVTDASGEIIEAESVVLYGNFISIVVDFLIISLCIFIMIKAIGGAKERLKKKPEPAPEPEKPEEPAPETELDVLKSIRDMLTASQAGAEKEEAE